MKKLVASLLAIVMACSILTGCGSSANGVKVVEIDQQGRINLSTKDALADIEARQQKNNG